ncbi:pyridoxamine 5'-phosphate oxidase family protein [Portibacter lacus]|uniref:Pyridoxamine 5'-phosphate oxidase n=1 Tax=Portibacter lacus TaxID=1099794 RepID=A0AA37WGG1_9BACT|nr:pyridoxamine 5'-phosphate oxidase family protein [Portibacter lacus]GLR18314.1 pyridoxamine 5'-phosphate oxidase [Portibacter lacus]
MAKQFESLSEAHINFIKEQKIFFIGTAAESGRVNVSPKGMDTLRVLSPNKVIWLNLTGSGNETAAHINQVNRMTIMFCAFDGKPLILRLYGHAKIYHERDPEFNEWVPQFGETEGARQIFELEIDLVQTSCGFAVPLMDFVEERSILRDWAKNKGKDKIKDYWEEKNQKSIDGFETGIF